VFIAHSDVDTIIYSRQFFLAELQYLGIWNAAIFRHNTFNTLTSSNIKTTALSPWVIALYYETRSSQSI